MKTYLKTLWVNPAAARKAICAIIGAVVILASQALLPHTINEWVVSITPVLTSLGVYHVRNDTPKDGA